MYRLRKTDQGTTFLWTEGYTATTRERLLEALRDAGLGAALLVLVAGSAGFITL